MLHEELQGCNKPSYIEKLALKLWDELKSVTFNCMLVLVLHYCKEKWVLKSNQVSWPVYQVVWSFFRLNRSTQDRSYPNITTIQVRSSQSSSSAKSGFPSLKCGPIFPPFGFDGCLSRLQTPTATICHTSNDTPILLHLGQIRVAIGITVSSWVPLRISGEREQKPHPSSLCLLAQQAHP